MGIQLTDDEIKALGEAYRLLERIAARHGITADGCQKNDSQEKSGTPPESESGDETAGDVSGVKPNSY